MRFRHHAAILPLLLLTGFLAARPTPAYANHVLLTYGDRVSGTLAFYYRDLRHFSEAEKSAASLLANLAAAAIGAAELYETQRRLAQDQSFVAEASELLGSSLDDETTLANVPSGASTSL